ncbi:hypothetical protein B566_EDAN014441 [Ephemera danica]|nr:hypothetical protein B566_EDAN014441 [Ephemera danica]
MYFPESYIRVNRVQRNDFAKTLSKLSLSWCEEECDVLDVGCGTADVTRHVLRPSLKCKNPRIVGIDVSQAMVDYARTSCTDELKFHLMNIATYEDPRLLRAVKNMYELLKPNGVIFLLFNTRAMTFSAEKKVINKQKWSKYLKGAPIATWPYEESKNPTEELKQIMEVAGFTVLTCEVSKKLIVFPTGDDLKDFQASVTPYQKIIPAEKMNEFMMEIVDELKFTEQNDGTYHIEYETIEVFARK